MNAYKDQVKRNYIFAAPNKAYAYFALFQQLNGYMIFDPLTSKEDVKCFAAVATSLNNLYPHADRSRNLYNMVIKGMKNTRTPQVKDVTLPADKIQEASIIDIELKDLNGKTHRLTDLKGKVVLIDFTAYSSAASGVRNLALRELYNKYASQGLVIYQISLDADEHFWKTAADNAEAVINSGKFPLTEIADYAKMWTDDEGTEVIFRPTMTPTELGWL